MTMPVGNLPVTRAARGNEARERGILFSGPMVRALLEGRKTQTRRSVKPQPVGEVYHRDDSPGIWYIDGETAHANPDAQRDWRCPYGVPGDTLWVRETWAALKFTKDWETGYVDGWYADPKGTTVYRATGDWDQANFAWKPAIHMPRARSRLTLTLTDVRVQRVQDISEEDAMAEGVTLDDREESRPARAAFLDLFYGINKRAPRDQNPWVWCLTFLPLPPADGDTGER